jgi:hypothetical protein
MYNMNRSFSYRTGLIIILLATSACVSRYRLNLYMATETWEKKAKIERSEYVVGAEIRDPYAQEKLVQGDANCLILRIGLRGRRIGTDMTETLFLGYDEYLRCLLYLELPETPETGSLKLKDRSFVQILGRYEESAEMKIFLPESGAVVVDSIVDKKLYASLDGNYLNNENTLVRFFGQFRVKVAH